MAVVFAPIQPFSAAIASGYGAAQVQQQANPELMRAYEANNQMRAQAAQAQQQRQLQSQLATNENATRASIAGYANLQHGLDQQAGIQQRQAEQEDQRNQFTSQLQFQAERDQFQAREAESHIALQAQAQAWVHQQDMTVREQMDLTRMQAAVSEIANDPHLDKEVRADLILQAKTHIDPLEAKLRATQLRRMDQESQAMAKRQQLLTDLQTGDQATKTRALAQMTVRIRNEATGEEEPFYATPNGELKPIPFQGKVEKPAKPPEPFDAVRAEKQAVAEVKGMNPGLQDTDPQFQGAVKEAFFRRYGEWQKQSGQPSQPQPNQPLQPPRPFNPDEARTQTPSQQQMMREFWQDRQSIANRSDLDDGRKTQVLSALDTLKSMMGSFGGAPPEGHPARQQFLALAQFVESAKPKPGAPAAAPVPAPTAPGPFGGMAPVPEGYGWGAQ